MMYREVSVIEVREVLRGWLSGAGLRVVAAQAGDGNDELLVQIRCATNTSRADSIYVLTQEPNRFAVLTVPVANPGKYDIRDDWKFKDNTLTITLIDRATNSAETHVMAWDGHQFSNRIGQTQA